MWSINEILDMQLPTKTAFVFYPDQGDVTLANDVIQSLEDIGCAVFVKQRRKHQAVSSKGTHVFDDVWYPSEAIVGPLLSDIVIAFGSTAYVDLVPVGVLYVNVDIHHDSYPWNVFKHPTATNYVRLTDASTVSDTIVQLTLGSKRVEKYVIDVAQLRDFIIQSLI
jgi:hypothetical protein